MSAIVYGQLAKRGDARQARMVALGAAPIADDKDNKLITAIAGLVPAEILALHALVLTRTTHTDEHGATTITDTSALKASLIVLVLLAMVGFAIGKGLHGWTGKDSVRLFVPPFAFLAWTGLIGTSALTPWVTKLSQGVLVLATGAVAVILIAVHSKVDSPSAG